MRSMWTIAWTTYGDAARRPLYYILLGAFSLLIFMSSFLTLFAFNQEANMVREMGVASLALWGFLIFAILAPIVVTQELEDRTAITLLAKPLTRSAFLLGKYFGLLLAALAGVVVLGGVLFFTLWWMARGELIGSEPMRAAQSLVLGVALLTAAIVTHVKAHRTDPDTRAGRALRHVMFHLYWMAIVALILAGTFAYGDRGKADLLWQVPMMRQTTVWNVIGAFMRDNGILVLEGMALSFLQIGLLGAICVSLAAFVPPVVSVAGTALAFILGNLSSYLLATLESSQVGAVRVVARGVYYLMPNLGYFNLQTHFSDGSIISPGYMGLAVLHAGLYATIVFLVSCALFERREIR